MPSRYLILIVTMASFMWSGLAVGEKVSKNKEETTPQVTEKKIDYSKIEWMSREELKAKYLTNEFSSTPFRTTGVFKSRPDYPIATASPLHDTAGYTYYDLANHDRLPRLIALSALGHVHIDWTKGYDATSSGPGKREIAYASFFSAGARVAFDEQVSGLGEDASKTRGGYTSLAVLPDGKAICCYHHAETVTGKPRGTWVSIEGTATVGDWLEEIHAPDSVLGMKSAGLYPACAGQKVTPGDTQIVHVVSVEFQGGNQDFVYTRGRGLSPVDFVFSSGAQRPDSSDFISVIVVASRKSNKVAIVYNRQTEFTGERTDADLFYIEDHEGGRNWVDGFGNDGSNDTKVNLTNYPDGAPIRASGDLSAVYDEDDSLHIVWVTPLYNSGLFASECYIYHWSKATGIDQLADGTFPVQDARLPSSVAKYNLRNPQIGVHDGTANISRKNYLYVTWSQYGPTPTGFTDLSQANIINGEIYVNASTSSGNTWGEPKNITNSHTPGCDSTCDADVYPSLAERINDTLHIAYTNDKRAGGLDEAGGEVLDPIYYYKYPAYQPAAFNGISTSPPAFEDPLADITIPLLVIDTELIITNAGNQNLTINSVTKVGASPWLKLQTAGFPDIIPEGGAPKIVACTLNGTGLVTGSYVDTIIVHNNSDNDTALKIPVHFVVSDCGYYRRSKVVATVGDTTGVTAGGIRIKMANTSNLADQDGTNGYFIMVVEKNMLFDGSGVVTTTTVDGDTVALQDVTGNSSVHPLSDIDTQFVNLPDTIAFAQALQQQRPAKGGDWLKIGPDTSAMFFPGISPAIAWPGPWFRYKIVDTWWIKNTPKPRYILWFRKLYKSNSPCWWPSLPATPYIAGNIYAGSLFDWDVPDDSGGVDDDWGNNDTLQMVWLQGEGPGASKNYLVAQAAMVDTGVHIGNPNGFWSAKVNRNSAAYGGPPWSDQDIYHQLSDSGFTPKTTANDSFTFEGKDRHIMWASVCFDTTSDTVTYCQALVITELGYDSLKKNVEKARLDMKLPLAGGCTRKPGNANGDVNQAVNLTDIIFVVNKVFKGGPASNPVCATNANGDGTLANLVDIVYLVNYVFKGGLPPIKSSVCCL